MNADDHAARSVRMGGVDSYEAELTRLMAEQEQQIAGCRETVLEFIRAFREVSAELPNKSVDTRIGGFASWLVTRLGVDYQAAGMLAVAVEMMSRVPEGMLRER